MQEDRAQHVFSRPLAVKRVPLLVLLLTSIIILTACQPTPTTPPVTGKSGGVQNNTQNSNLLQGVPQTWTYSATQGAVTLNVNAPVQLPQTSKIPVTTVQPTCFTQDAVNTIANQLTNGKQLYNYPHDYDPITKAQYQRLSNLFQALQSKPSILSDYISNDENRVIFRISAFLLAHGDSTKALAGMNSAPETLTLEPTNTQFVPVNESDIQGSNGQVSKGWHGQELNVLADSGKGYEMSLDIGNFTAPQMCNVQFINLDENEIYIYSEPTGNARGMSMSLDQAKTLAQTTLQKIGASDLKLTKVRLGTLLPQTVSDNPNTMKQAYGLWFTRDVTGVPTTVDITKENPSDYPPYDYERAFLLVNDNGVAELRWQSPMKTTRMVSSNVMIKSFNDAMNTFKQQFFLHYAQSDTSKRTSTYTINNITLGMMRVQAKDQTNTYEMIPVWDFFGSVTTKDSAGTTSTSNRALESILTINAMDGSIIDRKMGY
jgi:Family of unknown function (DUF6034)